MREQQLNKEAAQQVLMHEIYLPAFLEKCAQCGLEINSDSEVGEAIELVALLKQASSETTNSLLKSAAASMREALGIAQPEEREAEARMKAAAAESAKDERIMAALQALSASE
jgi:hypothetical protein